MRAITEEAAVTNEQFLAAATASFGAFAQATFQGFADTMGQTWAIAIQGGSGAAEQIKQQWNNFGASILSMLAKIIARLIIYRILLGALGPGGTILGLGAGQLMGFSGQTREGELRGIPGPPMQPLPIVAHGQEIIGRPGGGGFGNGAIIVQGDIYGWDESVERLRTGLFNHSQNTGLPVQA